MLERIILSILIFFGIQLGFANLFQVNNEEESLSEYKIKEGKTLKLTGNIQEGSEVSYTWETPDGETINNIKLIRESVTLAMQGDYTLTVNVDGCKNSSTIKVIVEKNTESVAGTDDGKTNQGTDTVTTEMPKIINEGFSPNGDNINDTWKIIDSKELRKYPNNILKIYNRHGNLVYHASPYNNNWDGSSNGLMHNNFIGTDKLKKGAYYYVFILDKNDKNKVLKGWVYINY